MRTKTIEMDGAKFIIGALSIEQVENFFADGKPRLKIDLVCMGLNNARNGDAEWTPERAKKELDYVIYERLHQEIIDFTGLKLDPKAPPGEAPATSAS